MSPLPHISLESDADTSLLVERISYLQERICTLEDELQGEVDYSVDLIKQRTDLTKKVLGLRGLCAALLQDTRSNVRQVWRVRKEKTALEKTLEGVKNRSASL